MYYFLQLLILVLPWFALSPWNKVFGMPGGYIYAALSGLFIVILVVNRPGLIKWDNIKNTPLIIPMLIFLVANVLSFVWASLSHGTGAFWSNNFKELSYLVFAVGYYWAVVNFLNNSEKLVGSVKIFLISISFAAIYGIGKLVLFMLGSPAGHAQPWTVPRLLAPAGEAQVMGGLIITLLPLAVAVVLYRIKYFSAFWGFLAAGIMLFTLVATFSAGAWIGFATAFVILLLWMPFYGFRQAFSLFLVFILVSSAIFIIDRSIHPGYLRGFDSITVKITGQPQRLSVKQDNQKDRLKLETPNKTDAKDVSMSPDLIAAKYQESVFSKVERSWFRAALWDMFKSSPVFGVGTGNFEKLYDKYRPGGTPQLPYTPKPHNQYMEILAETGLAGALAFCLIIVNLLGLLFQQWFVLSENGKKLVLGLAASLIAVAVQGYVFGILVHIQVWLLLALTISAISTCRYHGTNIYRGET